MLPSDPLPDAGPQRWIRVAAAAVAVTAFLAMTAAVLAGVAARYLGLSGFEWSFEAAAILFLWVSFPGLLVAEIRGENVAFTTLVERLGPTALKVVTALALLAVLWFAVRLSQSAFAFAARTGSSPTPVLRLPRLVQILPLVLAAPLLVAVAVLRLWHAVRPGARP